MIVKRFVLCAAMVMVTFTNHYLAAQDFNLTYTTEFQTDFRKGAKWVNLLRTDFLQSLGNSVNIEVASISVARTSDKKLVDDLQVYSNIEEENLPLALAILGINWHVGASSLFVGIRNLNEDYLIHRVHLCLPIAHAVYSLLCRLIIRLQIIRWLQ